MSDPVIERAKKLRERLGDVVRELEYVAKASEGSKQKLAEMDAQTCREAAEMLATLGIEVTRLRLGIGHLFYGRMDRIELNRMTKNWNDSPQTPEASHDR